MSFRLDVSDFCKTISLPKNWTSYVDDPLPNWPSLVWAQRAYFQYLDIQIEHIVNRRHLHEKGVRIADCFEHSRV